LFEHTTQSFYALYAVEGAERATKAGAYRVVKEDISLYLARRVRFLHRGESYTGDVLTVATWDDAYHPLILYFVIYCREVAIVCVEIEYEDWDVKSQL